MAGNIWKGSISFGLINIPVSLQKAEEGHEVPWQRVVKGYEYEKGQYVVLSKDDLKAANPKATQTIDIEDFFELKDIDLIMESTGLSLLRSLS